MKYPCRFEKAKSWNIFAFQQQNFYRPCRPQRSKRFERGTFFPSMFRKKRVSNVEIKFLLHLPTVQLAEAMLHTIRTLLVFLWRIG